LAGGQIGPAQQNLEFNALGKTVGQAPGGLKRGVPTPGREARLDERRSNGRRFGIPL
jgi:hypothetical protein